MKLSSEQIQRLYQFTRQHYVEYYDLQTELVDHLANSIEHRWQENPNISFEDALQIEFKKFGVFGFMDVVEKRQSVLGKKYNKLVLNNLKVFFTIPKIITTFLAVGIVFYLLKLFQRDFVIIQAVFFILITSFLVGIGIQSRKNKKHVTLTGKKWMFKEIIFGYSSISGLINLPIQFFIHLKGDNYNDWLLLLFSFLIVLLALIEYVVIVLIPSKANEYLKETYPEYEFAS